MIERVRRAAAAERATASGNYFTDPSPLAFIGSGCRLLDRALGGGWAAGRIVNVIGDKSTGKTLLAIEACANFAAQHPKGRIYYSETEAAFDQGYAAALGLPVARVDFGTRLATVEDWFEDLERVIGGKSRQPALYILDSLDALSDREELERAMDKGSYGAGKAKQMSETFRRLVHPLQEAQVSVMIISQVRDNIGVTFGRKWTRSGGRALDFYSSQTLVLSQLQKLTREVAKIKRAIGIEVRAYVDKNKVGLPFREVTFPLLFGYGIDDERACRKWLTDTGSKPAAKATLAELHTLVDRRWAEIEGKFLPAKRKYE